MKKIQAIVLGMALFMGLAAQGQEVSPVDFMRYNPYQMKSNPATDLPYESAMSLVIGNIDVDFQNSSFRYDNFFEFDEQGQPATLNLRQFANSLKKNNYLALNLNVDLFTLYRRTKHGMLTFNYGVKAQADAKCNDGLFKLLAYGNSAFVGEDNPAVVNMSVNAQVYQELAVGYQINVNKNLSLGFRPRLLSGFGDIRTDAFDAKLYTDADSYALRVDEDIAMRASMPSVIILKDGALATNGSFSIKDFFQNPGFAIDLAAEYHFTPKISLVAAVHDLGFIHWRGNNFQMNGKINDAGQFYDNGSFLYDGLEGDQLELVISDENYREQFFDSLQQYFNTEITPAERYNAMMNTNVLLRGNIDITPCNRISAQVQGRFLGSGFRPALTLAYCGSFFNNLNVCATYTVMPGSYDNIGFGLSWMIATCNIYLTTNNVIGCFKPLNAGGMNAQVGIVFNLWVPERRYVKQPKNSEPEPEEELE